MENDVALVYQLRCNRLVVYALNGVMKPGVALEVLDVFDCAGREVVNNEDFVAAM